MTRRLLCLLWLVGLWLAALPARAEETSLGAIGYGVVPLGSAAVTLVAEQVDLYLGPAEVEVRTISRLHNPGPATNLVIGFPQDRPRPGHPADAPELQDLQVEVDGEPLLTVFEPNVGAGVLAGFGGWHTLRIPFQAGQTRVLHGRYRGRNTTLPGGKACFQYALSSSATWPGPIEAVTVTLHLTGTLTWEHFAATGAGISPAGFRQEGNQVRWQWRNLEPDRSHDLALAFYRRPVRVRGQAEAALVEREMEPAPAKTAWPGWVPVGLVLLLVLLVVGLLGRRRRDPWRLD